MGCLMSRKSANNNNNNNNNDSSNLVPAATGTAGPEGQKQYSWSTREKRDTSHLIVENVHDQMIVRDPGEIGGEQFIVSGCERSTICLFDYMNTISIDDCIDCTLFIGPVVGSVAVRNCENCSIMSASQQFRARDCKRLNLFLFAATQPAIESCYNLRIGCYSANYNGLKEHFAKAGLNIFNNNWSSVYDFTMDDDNERHWTTFSLSTKAKDFFQTVPISDAILNLSFRTTTSLVPQTLGLAGFINGGGASGGGEGSSPRTSAAERLCLAFVYGSANHLKEKMEKLMAEIVVRHHDLQLVATKCLDAEQANAKINRIAFETMGGNADGKVVGTDTNKDVITTTSSNNNSSSSKSSKTKGHHQLKIEQLIVVVYLGRAASHVLTDSLDRFFKSDKASVQYKIVSSEPPPGVGAGLQQRSESLDNFNYFASIAFDNFLVVRDSSGSEHF